MTGGNRLHTSVVQLTVHPHSRREEKQRTGFLMMPAAIGSPFVVNRKIFFEISSRGCNSGVVYFQVLVFPRRQ